MFEDNYNQTSNAAKQNFKSQRDSISSMCNLLSHKKGFIYLRDKIMLQLSGYMLSGSTRNMNTVILLIIN